MPLGGRRTKPKRRGKQQEKLRESVELLYVEVKVIWRAERGNRTDARKRIKEKKKKGGENK